MDERIYSTFFIPVPPREIHVVQYKVLRLLAVQTNPECFSSPYEREILLTHDQWRARLSTSDRVTIIASVSRTPPFQSQNASAEEGEWVGMVTIVGPKALEGPGFLPLEIALQEDSVPFLLVGAWVQPEHRMRGVGRKLMDAGIEWVKNEELEGGSGKIRGLLLQVRKENQEAKSLYTKIGFEPVVSDDSELDWMIKYIS